MRPDIIFEVATWSIAILLPVGFVWLATCWIRKRWARNYARVLITPAFILVSSPFVLGFTGVACDRGTWKCTICGAAQYQVRLVGLPLLREMRLDDCHRDFESWYECAFHEPHKHDWSLAIGCHYSGSFVGCSFDAGGAYYSAIPRIPSTAIATSMVQRMQRASTSERLELIRGFPKAEMDEPFASLRDAGRMSIEQFARGCPAWLQSHPEWR